MPQPRPKQMENERQGKQKEVCIYCYNHHPLIHEQQSSPIIGRGNPCDCAVFCQLRLMVTSVERRTHFAKSEKGITSCLDVLNAVSVCLSFCLSVRPFVRPFVRMSIRLSVRLSVFLLLMIECSGCGH